MLNDEKIDEKTLEVIILDLLLKTEETNDRTYLDTVKRILEGNERSKIAEKYKNESFYRRFPNINKGLIGKMLKKLSTEQKIIGHEGKNKLLYFTVNPEYMSEIEKNEKSRLEILLSGQLI